MSDSTFTGLARPFIAFLCEKHVLVCDNDLLSVPFLTLLLSRFHFLPSQLTRRDHLGTTTLLTHELFSQLARGRFARRVIHRPPLGGIRPGSRLVNAEVGTATCLEIHKCTSLMELLLAMLAGELRLRVIPVYLFGQISLCQVSLQSQRRLICPIVILFNLYVITLEESIYI